MPELPEVETVKRSLAAKILQIPILDVEVLFPKVIKFPSAVDFSAILRGKRFVSIDRKGKYLLFHLDDGHVLIVHLRMTGRLLWVKEEAALVKHTHIVIVFENGYQLRFQDQRQFGTLHLLPGNQLHLLAGLDKLGPEPLTNLSVTGLKDSLSKSRRKIKDVILDQTIIAGIGNIYADEILFAAALHPERPAKSLTDEEIIRLYEAMLSRLEAGIRHRGTSFRDYVDGEGKQGEFQALLKVYGREGLPCFQCGSLICRHRIGGRSSCFCPACQK
ncbi:MAG: DNA-formamidopyrimidine glycosylase [Syntrophomonadaceae bacterium]|nr:DNA-formamidopyrimidine glycosylase [Syntrophomonadaceae bacterium]